MHIHTNRRLRHYRYVWLLALGLTVGAANHAVVQQMIVAGMTSDEIRAAIQLSEDDKAARKLLDSYVVQSRAGWGNGPLIGSFSTPFARVVQASLAARKLSKPFTPADVTPDMIVPELHVIATAQDPALDAPDVAAVQSIVVTTRANKNPAEAIQPMRTTELTKEYQTMYGLALPRPGMVAVFPLDVLSVNNEIRVVFDRMAKGSSAAAMCRECVVPFPSRNVR
jgi:hypothetical protein